MTGFAHQFPFGATWLGNNRARFRLWAPSQRNVELVIDGQAPAAMHARAEGWFEIEADCAPLSKYQYRLDSALMVPDPASRAQSEDVHGPSLVIDPLHYRWQQSGWLGRPWHEVVLYEVHVGAYGGYRALAGDLDRLARLGVTAIELMPVADFSGTRNWGYDGVLPFAADHAYGRPDDLKALIDAAHERRLMMFLDVVYNHFGPDGNYLASYAPQFFRYDLHTPWGQAIDYREQEVRRYFTENALYWLMEYRFDGLRFDAAQAISDAQWLDDMAGEIRRTVEPGRHVHLVLEHDENEASHLRKGYDGQWNDDAHHALHVLLTGETDGYYSDYAAKPAEHLARCLEQGFAYQGEASGYRGGKARGTASADLPPTSFVLFLQNHDQIGNRPFGDRLTTLCAPPALHAAAALQLLCPGIPLLFMGEEWQSLTPFLYFTDYHDGLADAVREGRSSEFKRFSSFSGKDIPDPNALETFTRSRLEQAGNDSFYKELLHLRHATIIPRLAGTRAIDAVPMGAAAVFARWRMGDGCLLEIAANLGEKSCAAPAFHGDRLFATRPEALVDETLAAYSTIVHLGAAT